MFRQKAVKAFLIFTLITGLFLVTTNLYMADQNLIYRFFERNGHSNVPTFERKNECRLIKVDPWDPQVIPHLKPAWNPLKMCSVTRQMHTELKNYTIRMLRATTSKCEYRCLHVSDELTLKPNNWTKMEKNKEYHETCEFIETHCVKHGATNFRYIHDQLVRPKEKVFQKEDDLHPSVFMLVLDSTSSSSGIRTMMETNQVLRQFYDSTTFYHHNKVGLNSRPNAFAMFSGTRISELDKHRFPGKSESEYPNSCNDGVKRNDTVTYDFIDQNYASVIAEDWIGAFNWPNCKGYGYPPTDHFCNALVIRSTEKQPRKEEEDFDRHFYKGECQEPYHKLMNFVSKFLDEYKGIAKFAMIWLSLIAHDSPDGLYHTDKFFADFFRSHVDNLNNSFVFLMGDHGLRFGGIRSTSPGQVEDNNPLFTIVLPNYLRSNEQLILNLKRNSRRHTSQFDFYATLYDIARYARKEKFRKWDQHDFRSEFGEIRGGTRAKSMLRPILYDRTCEEMEIPEEYCICEQTWVNVDIYGDDATKAAQTIISYINDYLKQKNLDAEYLEEQSILKVVIGASPSNGKYEAQLVRENDGFKIISRITRLDKYGNQGYCAPAEDVRPLCYCRKKRDSYNKLMTDVT